MIRPQRALLDGITHPSPLTTMSRYVTTGTRPDASRVRRLWLAPPGDRQVDDPRPDLMPGDLLLYRADAELMDLTISAFTGSIWIHAAMMAWDADEERWEILETIQYHGGRRTPLYESVVKHPGHWDVFRSNAGDRWPEFSRAAAIARMDTFVGRPYGWLSLVRAALTHFPLFNLVLRYDIKEGRDDGDLPFCSQAVAIATRAGGVDPVPNRPACHIEPVHLAQSPFFEYVGTLWPLEESD